MRKQVEQAIRFFNDKTTRPSDLLPQVALTQGKLLAEEVLRLNQLVAKTSKRINHTCNKIIQNSCKDG